MRYKRAFLSAAAFFLAAAPAFAETAVSRVDTGDTAWVLLCAALVMLMTPGLAIFYGGMVRRKNILGTMLQSFIALGVVSIQWALIGYSLSFGPDLYGVIGDLSWAGLRGVGLEPNADYAPTIPHQAFMVFQMMFAVITPAVISGAFAERFKFGAYLLFVIFWTTLVYDPLCHWVWAKDGWLRGMGVLDFAGGIVVEINSGMSALAAAWFIGSRRGYPHEPMLPHNLPLTLLGGGLLWFGWFGFNAGSAVASGALATSAFVATHLATAAAVMGWLLAEWKHRGKPTLLGAVSGAVAGLVAITPACGFVGPLAAIAIGLVAGAACYGAVVAKFRMGYDDTLDAFGVHGVGGMIGMAGTGLFAAAAINAAGADGFFNGNFMLLGKQMLGIAVGAAWAFGGTYVILKALDKTIGIRVTRDEETQGLDLTQHGENAYTM
ncbi:MAG: ammonium transporter [Nitrospinae bacterium]|nr:ammonium transporter [Nitrospinota bacterium]